MKSIGFLSFIALSYLLCPVLIGYGILWLLRLGKQTAQRNTDAEEERWKLRLANPQFDEVEAHTGFPLPHSIRELYTDPNFLSMAPFLVPYEGETDRDGGWEVNYFFPLDPDSLTGSFSEELRSYLPFATDDGHGYYCLPLPLCTADDGPIVYLGDSVEDEDEFEHVAASLRDFIARRQPVDYQ
jgi:hypothetical protein